MFSAHGGSIWILFALSGGAIFCKRTPILQAEAQLRGQVAHAKKQNHYSVMTTLFPGVFFLGLRLLQKPQAEKQPLGPGSHLDQGPTWALVP